MTASNSTEFDISKIPPYQPRRFVPIDLEPARPEEVCAQYQRLVERPIDSYTEMEKFLMDWSELESVVSEYFTILSIRMTCQTDDIAKADAFAHFTQQVLPAVKPMVHQLKAKLVLFYDSITPLNDRWAVFVRNARADVEIFRKENVELEKQEDALIQDYQAVCGAMVVEFQGNEFTMSQMRHKLAEPNRALREAAWRATVQRRQQDADRLEDIFDKLISLRHKIAINTGYTNYRDYKFKQYHRFDYTPADCKQYHNAVIETAVPVFEKIMRHRCRIMKNETTRPWDFDPVNPVDPCGRAPLHPFRQVKDLIRGIRTMVGRLHPDFDCVISKMDSLGLLDLESRKGKAPGGYQESLQECRRQFIFGSIVGSNEDINLMLHECGHAFHADACRDDPMEAYRYPPTEFAEVASKTIELLGARHLDVFYSTADAQRAWRENLEGIVYGLVWVANVNEFQDWIYENPEKDRYCRRKAWEEINERLFGKLYDWSGLAEFRAIRWHAQLHIFQFPFYFIEYGIAQLGALGIWLQAKSDLGNAIKNYREALSLGGSKPLPDLFAAAGLKFDFSARTITPLLETVMAEWQLVRDA